VLVPVFDNVATVASVVGRARELGFVVIAVDDGSRDGSGETAGLAGARVFRHAENRGKGAALKTGFREALALGHTHAVSIDADGQHFPEDIPSVVQIARGSPDAIVAGVRDLASQEHAQKP
jgi:glycosyltransferase involved in cell wall biosynthesis